MLADLVRREVAKLIDRRAWDAAVERERRARTELTALSARYADAVAAVVDGSETTDADMDDEVNFDDIDDRDE